MKVLHLHKNPEHYFCGHCISKYATYVLITCLRVLCFTHQELHTEEAEADANDPVLLRKKRMTQVEKNTCQLFIQTDHLFYKYYKTREAVIAQVTHTARSLHRHVHTLWYCKNEKYVDLVWCRVIRS